jgi:hypothetical protein
MDVSVCVIVIAAVVSVMWRFVQLWWTTMMMMTWWLVFAFVAAEIEMQVLDSL